MTPADPADSAVSGGATALFVGRKVCLYSLMVNSVLVGMTAFLCIPVSQGSGCFPETGILLADFGK